jgi:hypothetical protein
VANLKLQQTTNDRIRLAVSHRYTSLGRESVQRVLLAFVFVPVFVSFFFGPFFFIVIPIAWFVCLVLAGPLFVLFSRLGWLRCWQVTGAGLICGLLLAVISILGDGLYSAIQAPANLTMFAGVGGVMAYGFWWFGLYRNESFNGTAGNSVIGALVLLPVLLCFGALYKLYLPSLTEAVTVNSAATSQGLRDAVTIRLSNGKLVSAELSDSARRPSADEKLIVEFRRNVAMMGKRYWIIARSKN